MCVHLPRIPIQSFTSSWVSDESLSLAIAEKEREKTVLQSLESCDNAKVGQIDNNRGVVRIREIGKMVGC